jgi:hypothetical protein
MIEVTIIRNYRYIGEQLCDLVRSTNLYLLYQVISSMVDTEIGVDDRDDENEVVSTDNIDYIDDDDEDAS